MTLRRYYFKSLLALSALATLFWIGTPAIAQNVPGQNNGTAQDNDITRKELMNFDQFLDSHPRLAEQIHRDPSVLSDDEFVQSHPALQTFLNDHPAVREEIQENPSAFMQREARFERTENDNGVRDRDRDRDNDTTRGELAKFDQFLDNHRETAEQIRKDPSLVNNKTFLQSHPALQTFLNDHPAVREEIQENPSAFMQQEARFERTENRDRNNDTTRGELARFDQFLDNHRETAQQIRKDPSLVNDKTFLQSHPALQTFLNDHPAVREEIQENPSAFMQREARFERTENDNGVRDRDRDRDNDTTRGELAKFDQFLDNHRETAEQIRKDPSLVNNKTFLQSHPALQTFLNDHPAVREEIQENPSAFMQQEARFERTENDNGVRDRDRGFDRDRDPESLHRQFGEFLGTHSSVAQELSKDPSMVKNEEFMEMHSDLKEFLSAHPDLQQQLMKDPQTFISSAQKFSGGTTSGTGKSTSTTTKAPTTGSKPQQ